jgi:hypothetical protein
LWKCDRIPQTVNEKYCSSKLRDLDDAIAISTLEVAPLDLKRSIILASSNTKSISSLLAQAL